MGCFLAASLQSDPFASAQIDQFAGFSRLHQ
jgi:hypothetical protein